jgi:hypothetical protein
MSKKEPQETEHVRTEPVELANSSAEAPQAANVARRRALIAGLAAAPAVLTLFGRPVWAQTSTRQASAGICASLAAASSLHRDDTQLAIECEALSQPTSEPTSPQ